MRGRISGATRRVRTCFLRTSMVVLAAACVLAAPAADAETVKIGYIKVAAHAPVFIALEKGYFAAEGLDVELVPFDAPVPVALAVVSGAVDFGSTGPSGAFYNLAGQGALRIIAGTTREAPGFQFLIVVASKRAFAAGLTSLTALPGHSVAVSDIGGAAHYSLNLIFDKYHIAPNSVRVIPLQSISNAVSALEGGSADATVNPTTAIDPVIARGDVKRLAYVGDETPWQAGIIYTSKKTADGRHALVEAVLRAIRKAARDDHDAFTGPDGKRWDGPTAPATVAMMAKFLGQSPQQVARGIAYVDPELRLDVKDILRQVAWFREEGLVKTVFDPRSVIDMRYVVPLSGP